MDYSGRPAFQPQNTWKRLGFPSVEARVLVSTAQATFKHTNPPSSPSAVLGLQLCTTTPSSLGRCGQRAPHQQVPTNTNLLGVPCALPQGYHSEDRLKPPTMSSASMLAGRAKRESFSYTVSRNSYRPTPNSVTPPTI